MIQSPLCPCVVLPQLHPGCLQPRLSSSQQAKDADALLPRCASIGHEVPRQKAPRGEKFVKGVSPADVEEEGELRAEQEARERVEAPPPAVEVGRQKSRPGQMFAGRIECLNSGNTAFAMRGGTTVHC